MQISERVIKLASGSEARYNARAAIRETRLQAADQGHFWAADDPDRIAKRFSHLRETTQECTAPLNINEGIRGLGGSPDGEDLEAALKALAQERTIGRDDLVAMGAKLLYATSNIK